jgi:hypothetical protein
MDTLLVKRVEWSAENPHAHHGNLLHLLKTGVSCSVSRNGKVGPLFFEEKITAKNYPNILTQFIAFLEENKWDR